MNAPEGENSYLLPLRSKLLDWLERSPQNIASASQWVGVISNLPGIRIEEIVQSGIFRFLDDDCEPSKRVPKKVLINIAAKALKQCEPTLGANWRFGFRPSLDVKVMVDRRPKRVEAEAKRFVDKAQTCYQHPSMGYWMIRTNYEDFWICAPNWIVLDDKGKMLRSHKKHGGWFPSSLEAFDVMHETIRRRMHAFGKNQPDTHFEMYSLLGGQNYQEWFIRLPNWRFMYRDEHFKVDQLLMHIRTTERMDCDGQLLLMVEEIQSPWHAELRQYRSESEQIEDTVEDDAINSNSIADAPFTDEWHELGIKAIIWLAIKQGFDHIGFTTGKQQCNRWGELVGLKILYDQQIPRCLKKIARQYDCIYSQTLIETRRPYSRVQENRQSDWELRNAENEPVSPPVSDQKIALFYLTQRSPKIKESIRVLQISSSLKKAALAGEMPLFGW